MWLRHEEVVRDTFQVGEGWWASIGSVHGSAAQWGEAHDGCRDRWSPAVPELSVTVYASMRSLWRGRWGSPWLEAAVHVEALVAARLEGI
jgi:hypothetical protein